MCGIVGLFLKDPALESELGSMLADMLEELGDRGPDSTGVAVYGRETPGRWKLTVRLPADLTGPDLAAALGEALNADVAMEARGVHALLLDSGGDRGESRALASPREAGCRGGGRRSPDGAL